MIESESVLDTKHHDDATEVEAAFTEIVSGVLQVDVDQVPIDGHFFDDLGADSLTMARFCARVRKRGDLPVASMRDIYQHPTVRSLAAALTGTARGESESPASPEPEVEAVQTTRWEYLLCGTLQALFFLGYTCVVTSVIAEAWQWVAAPTGTAAIYVRLVLVTSAAFFIFTALPIAAKWLLIGRWESRQIRIWSLDYVRFWIVKTLVQTNPGAHLLVGSPLYGFYLRALGARVGPGALILSRRIPACTDLLSIGAGTVIRRETSFTCYRARAGRIEIGPVTLGREVFIGERSVLDIGTAMGDGAQLGHASALQTGQSVPSGECWNGSPAEPAGAEYPRVPPARCGKRRRIIYSAFMLFGILLLYVPLVEAALGALFTIVSSWVDSLVPGASTASGTLTSTGVVAEAFIYSAILFFGTALVGLIAAGTVPRVLNLLLEPGTVYPLYGFHHLLHRAISGLGRVRFFPLLFGDSSYIVHYLRWIGYHLTPVVQTGSNFGIEVIAANPFLTYVGSDTMVADGLQLINDEFSNTSFRLSPVTIGPRNFIGNDVIYPPGGRTGDNCLLATKVMVPIDGPRRQGTGLLGSPAFGIPRTVERDRRYDEFHEAAALRRALSAKNRFNLRTMGVFLFTRWLGVFLITAIDVAAFELYDVFAHTITFALAALSIVVGGAYYALAERFFELMGPPPPRICSIYDRDFWQVERLWKLNPIYYLRIFDGTPFKNLMWRLMGVRIGKRVFDDGAFISEPTLTTVGDACVLNHRSKIQCHSQEDGTFKSAPSTLGAGCTLGIGALVHYGVTMGDGAQLDADAFLMKGEEMPAHSRWAGNPAREMTRETRREHARSK